MRATALTIALLASLLTGCADDRTTPATSCPTAPVPVVASIGPWGDIAAAVGGDCVTVTTIVRGSGIDPHEYEPTAGDLARFEGAAVVVLNGAGYDEWATDAVAAVEDRPVMLDAAEIAGRSAEDNPHLWYDPSVVRALSTQLTEELLRLRPATRASFEEAGARWAADLGRLDDQIAAIRTTAEGARYAATEPVFDLMAAALGLTDATPPGWKRAAANETDPGPSDLAAFEALLRSGSIAVLVLNPQTAGSTTTQLRRVAADSGVPVVEITESRPRSERTFLDWQTSQLTALESALRS